MSRPWKAAVLSTSSFILAACMPPVQPNPHDASTSAPVASASSSPTLPACTIVSTAPALVDAAWNMSLDPPTGVFKIEITDGLAVAELQGGRSISVDTETGLGCAMLTQISKPGSPAPVSPINAYSAQTAVSHGSLVGPAGSGIAAVELRTGATRWKRDAIEPNMDEYTLRDGLQIASTANDVIVAFLSRRNDPDSFQFDEIVAALDPVTGKDRWRKTVVSHPRGKPVGQKGTVRIYSNGALVFIRANGKLTALGESGNELWSVAAPADSLVASDEAHVAIALHQKIQLLDARTGATSGETVLAGRTVTELLLHRNVVYAALEAQPGNASVVAVDAKTAKSLWTHGVAYSVGRMRVRDEALYVLDGNERIWGLDLATGAPRFGVHTYSPDFEVAATSRGPRLIVAGIGLAAIDTRAAGAPPPLKSFARWDIKSTNSTAGTQCHFQSVSWVDGNEHVLWQRDLPPRLRNLSLGDCEVGAAAYRRAPRTSRDFMHTDLSVAVEDVLIESFPEGLLVLQKSDGKIVQDIELPIATEQLMFDDGTFTLQGPTNCHGDARHASIRERCNDHLVLFNGSTAMVIALKPFQIEARGQFSRAQETGSSTGTTTIIPLGNYTLTIKGKTYMR